jgi:hypothetical protein
VALTPLAAEPAAVPPLPRRLRVDLTESLADAPLVLFEADARFPSARVLTAGTNITLDLSDPGKVIINAAAAAARPRRGASYRRTRRRSARRTARRSSLRLTTSTYGRPHSHRRQRHRARRVDARLLIVSADGGGGGGYDAATFAADPPAPGAFTARNVNDATLTADADGVLVVRAPVARANLLQSWTKATAHPSGRQGDDAVLRAAQSRGQQLDGVVLREAATGLQAVYGVAPRTAAAATATTPRA